MRFGLLGIKHVGTGIVEATVKGREEGEYTSLEEYLRRVSVVDRTALNRKAVESLIYAGALDSFGVPRAQMMADLEMSLAGIQNARRQNLSGQQSLFGTFPDLETPSSWTSRRLPEYPQPQKLAYEQEVLGKVRKYYQITPEGRKHLEQKKEEWKEYAKAVGNVLAMEV